MHDLYGLIFNSLFYNSTNYEGDWRVYIPNEYNNHNISEIFLKKILYSRRMYGNVYFKDYEGGLYLFK